MKLTKLQRYTAYCIILEEFESGDCLCKIWERITDDESWWYLNEILPELFAKRTLRYSDVITFWFNNDFERVAALQQCIKETEPK